MSITLLREKEKSLAKYLFKWAQANGLAELPEQIRVSVRIVKRLFSDQLTEADWKVVLSGRFRWDVEQKQFLDIIKVSGNSFNPYQSDLATPDWMYRIEGSVRSRLHLSGKPYILSCAGGFYSIRKHLITGRARVATKA
jgi:hypothetical protein